MLILFRRHRKSCKHKARGRKHRHCQCPIWIDGTLSERRILESLRMRDWQRAHEKMLQWEADGKRAEESRKRIQPAWEDFLADMDARNLNDSTVRKYKLLRKQLEAFAQQKGFRFLDELDLNALSQFRNGWADGPRSSAKKLERLRSFLRFAVKRRWIQENPATDLKSPKIQLRQTLPFTRPEMERLLKASRQYAKESTGRGRENSLRMQAFILLLRYSGMRIGDAVSLSTDRLKGDRLFLYTAKTGTPVNVVLPAPVVRVIAKMPKTGKTHFFWSSNGKVDSVASHWRKRLQRLLNLPRCQTLTRIASATRLLPSYCWPEYQSSGFRFC
jgi:site-specific recombinase XerD